MALFVRKRKDGGVQVSGDDDFITPPPEVHHFSRRWVDRARLEGFAVVDDSTITVGEAIYELVQRPGAYCVYCGEKIGEGPATSKSESDIRNAYTAVCEKSDGSAVAGYEVIDYYKGELRG